jgi:hypothetical protein
MLRYLDLKIDHNPKINRENYSTPLFFENPAICTGFVLGQRRSHGKYPMLIGLGGENTKFKVSEIRKKSVKTRILRNKKDDILFF